MPHPHGTILRWAGSKRLLLPELRAAVPSGYTRYLEPFAGSACLFFELEPEDAVLGDFNRDLIDAYAVIARYPKRTARRMLSWPRSSAFYYALRSTQPASLGPIGRAARFVYLNRFCFNGVFRVNRRGEFNVPRGVRTGRLPSTQRMCKAATALRAARLVAGDFEKVLRLARAGDFVYLDPPYASTSRKGYGEYGYDGCFGPPDIPRLRSALRTLDEVNATFLLSYSAERSRELSQGWYTKTLTVRRHIAGFSSHRGTSREVLVSNRKLP